MIDLPHLKHANTTEKGLLEVNIECTPLERRYHHNARAKWLKEQRERDLHETKIERDKKIRVMARKEGFCLFWKCDQPAKKKGNLMCEKHAQQYNGYDKQSKKRRGRR